MVETHLEKVVPADYASVGALRRATDHFLPNGEDRFRSQLLLVVSELCTNAIEAMHDPSAEFTLRVHDQPDRVEVEVTDAGPGFGDALTRPGASDAEPRGRGLQIVVALVDEMTVNRRGSQTMVRCVMRKAHSAKARR